MADGTEPTALAPPKQPKPLWTRAGRFHQVGFVVPNLERAIDELSGALGVEPCHWRVFDGGEPFEHHEGAQQIAALARYARIQSGPTVYQVLEPITPGTIWQRWLNSGVRQFAVGYYVSDLPAAESELSRSGAERIAWGQITEDGAAFRYSFFQLPETGVVIEVMSAEGGAVPPAASGPTADGTSDQR